MKKILPLPGAHFYVQRDQLWFRVGCYLPEFDVPPSTEYRPLHQILSLGPFKTQPAPEQKWEPTILSLVADDRVRPTTAALCPLISLARWIETVPGPRLARIQAARCGDRILLLGDRLPLVPGGERFWGRAVLTPLGYRPEPNLPESALCDALKIAEEEFLLWSSEGAETISRQVFAPLTRGGVRLAVKESI